MSANPLHIDIPVTLTALRVAFSVPALTFEGDLPASLFHLQLLTTDAEDWKADADIVAVFHTNAGHVTLSDQAYDAERNVATGNPYKALVARLQARGVRIELCGATAKAPSVGQRRPAAMDLDQHRCDGENDAARAGRIRTNAE